MLTTRFIADEIKYTGEQLRSLWAYRTFGILGDSAVSFIGPCEIKPEAMVDLEDVLSHSEIRGSRMLHFIGEHFDNDLALAVARQRLLICLMQEEIHARLGRPLLRRDGDDLYDGARKLSISIATVSPVSTLIHAALNIQTEGVPVPACGLAEYDIEPAAFAEKILARYRDEIESMSRARCKVRPVE
jgi:uncharacterized protein